MDQSQRQSMKMVFVLMVSAVLCAIASFVAIALVINRSDTQSPEIAIPVVVTVAGTPIILDPDPDKFVVLASEAGTAIAPESEVTAQPTASAPPTETLIPPTATPVPPTATPKPPEVVFVSYTVVSGDSLYRITKKQNTSIDLMALYGIASVDIVVGNVLNLPVANPAFCPGTTPYVVRDKQTVSTIAAQFGTTPEAIRDLNGLDSNYTIKTTQVICIP